MSHMCRYHFDRGIAVEVTWVVVTSPALWYFMSHMCRYHFDRGIAVEVTWVVVTSPALWYFKVQRAYF